MGKGSGEAAQGLRLDNDKDNDIQKRNLPFLLKKLIVLAIVQSEREIYIYMCVYVKKISLVCVFVGARTLRSLVVLAPCACVDFIILFQLADLGPGLGLGGLSHFFLGGAARAFRSLVVLAPRACVDFIILFQLANLGPGLGLGRPSHFYFLLIVWREMPQDAPYRVGWGLGGIIAFYFLAFYISTHASTQACTHIYIYIHIFTHTYIYIYIHMLLSHVYARVRIHT